jgi:hypothetical protein
MKVVFDSKNLFNDLNNLAEYSIGFLDGIKLGENNFLDNLGQSTIESMKNFIDSNARSQPQTLHHVYEWYQTGSPEARLFDLEYVVKDSGLSFNYSFSQSRSFSNGAKEPFYDKAQIMENGIPVTIRPKNAKVLSFDDNGTQVFTKNPIIVANPGGDSVSGSFERILDEFFNVYFQQSYLYISGVLQYLQNPIAYKQNISAGVKQGKSIGLKVGYEWISKGGKIEQ